MDDEPAIAAMFADIVRDEGCTPVIATSGHEAWLALTKLGGAVALILLDVFMPDMDGFEFRGMQRAAPELQAIPAVIVSGASLDDAELGRLAPAECLAKPVRIEQLRWAIVRHVYGAAAAVGADSAA